MITLIKLIHLNDGTYYAKWHDEEDGLGYTFAAIHDANGRSQVCNMNLHPPRLTTAQMETATPDRHPAYDLADKGTAARPDLAARMQKAAAIVEAGDVTLMTETAHVNQYEITAVSCTCPDFTHRAPNGWCKHRLAVRMARALGQPVTGNVTSGLTEAEKERLYQERIRANREHQLARNAEFSQRRREDEVAYRKWCDTSPEAARRYVLAAAANGRIAALAGSKLNHKQIQAGMHKEGK